MQSKPSLADVLARGLAGVFAGKAIGEREKGFYSRWGWDWSTWSGSSVSQETALQNDTVWACTKKISEAVGTLPVGFFEKANDGTRVLSTSHALYDILHNQPNARMSAVNFWQAIVTSMLLWGNGYAEIVRNADRSRVISLNFLLPDRMRLTWDQDDGALRYEYYEPATGKTRPIGADNVFHCRAFNLDGEVGLSAIQYGRNAIGTTLAIHEAAATTFRDATRASGIVTMDAVLSDKHREQVREHVKEVSRKGGVYVLEKGTGFHGLQFNPHDAELLATMSFSVETICRWFGMAPVMIGHGDKQSSWPTSTEAQAVLFVQYVLRAIICRIEQEIRRALLTPVERLRYFAEFSVEGLLRGDSKTRAEFYASAILNGWMTRNEVRRLENLPPLPGGDVLTVQSQLVPLEMIGQEPPPAEGVRSALQAWLQDEFKKLGTELRAERGTTLIVRNEPPSVDLRQPLQVSVEQAAGDPRRVTRIVKHERDPATGLITHSTVTETAEEA
jgi:HK97 family phage portal protein